MFRFFPCRLFPIEPDFRIALTVRNTCHCEIHTDFRAFTLEIAAQIIDDVFRYALRNADDVLRRPNHFFLYFVKLRCGLLADRAELRRGCTLMNVTANAANPLFDHVTKPPILIL